MSASDLSDRVRSLAAADAGELVEIRSILFDSVRGLCSELGLREGDVLKCRAGTASHILLETTRGRTVALERDWARFIQVNSALDNRRNGFSELSRAAG